jgi:hypothetical protein
VVRETCLPLAKDGPEVDATKMLLVDCLRAQGLVVSHEADAHIAADGERIEPIRISESRLAFALPAGAETILLRSHVFVPASVDPESLDVRELGLCLKRLQIDGEDIALDHGSALDRGWQAAEHEGGAFARRWTTGAAVLPAGARVLILDLAGRGSYWRAAEDIATALFG